MSHYEHEPSAAEFVAAPGERRDADLDEIERLRSQKDGAYSERDRLVAALGKCCIALGGECWIGRHDPSDKTWDDDWRNIVYMRFQGSEQMSWHVHQSEAPWFMSWIQFKDETWDGHDTDEKYRRLEALSFITRAAIPPPKTKIVNGETCVGDFERFGPEGWVQCPECLHVGPLEAATPPKADDALREQIQERVRKAIQNHKDGILFSHSRDAADYAAQQILALLRRSEPQPVLTPDQRTAIRYAAGWMAWDGDTKGEATLRAMLAEPQPAPNPPAAER